MQAPEYKILITPLVSFLYIVLFTYAATSKLLNFEQFQAQMGQSPILTAFADYTVWIIPILEYGLALLLIIPKYRLSGLFASLGLMTAFTTYIFLILNFADYIPCSCGGVLENLSWKEHLFFNIGFLILAIIGITAQKTFIKISTRIKQLLLISVCSAGSVMLLFTVSDNRIRFNNSLIRIYPHHPVVFEKSIDLGYNSYYIAGINQKNIYLGNTTAPLHVLSVNRKRNDTTHHTIHLPKNDSMAYRAIQLEIVQDQFFVADGTVPVILLGDTLTWSTNQIVENLPHFSLSKAIDSNHVVFRYRDMNTNRDLIGTANLNVDNTLHMYNDLLQQQEDGVFSTDGMLIYDHLAEQVVYVYYYRNEYVLANRELDLLHRGRTIDTTAQAQLDIQKINNKNSIKISGIPRYVNKRSASYGNYLIINSEVLGKYDDTQMLKDAFIIDVYDLSDHSYLLSFYLYKHGDGILKDIQIHGDQVIAIIGSHLNIYKMKKEYFSELKL